VLSNLMRLPMSILRETERLLIEKDLITYGERGRELTKAGGIRARDGLDHGKSPRGQQAAA
jgi:hypothetical protein